jgi:predicted transcriptional regulator
LPRRQHSAQSLTPLELKIMEVLWKTGPTDVRTVRARLKDHELAYTTVQTVLNILHRKGKLARQLHGRGFLYQPILSRPQVIRQDEVQLLERFSASSASSLVLHLVAGEQVNAEDLARIQGLLKHLPLESLAKISPGTRWWDE